MLAVLINLLFFMVNFRKRNLEVANGRAKNVNLRSLE